MKWLWVIIKAIVVTYIVQGVEKKLTLAIISDNEKKHEPNSDNIIRKTELIVIKLRER